MKFAALGLAMLLTGSLAAQSDNQVVLELRPTRENPRNSEGGFAQLKSGRILFYYTQFYGGNHDHHAARIAGIHSDDDGRTWSAPREIIRGVDGQGLNVMSASLLTLASGKLALFYLFTKSTEDCRPYIAWSADGGESWTPPRLAVHLPGYFILNNDRVIQTRSGRLIMPLNSHRMAGTRGAAGWWYSDDEGATWRESLSRWGIAEGNSGLQENGVVETPGGALFSWARTDLGSQYQFRSTDDGKTWSAPEPSGLVSPLSPASIKRLPGSDALLAIYNDHSGQFPFVAGKRTPLVAAISSDDGRTWPERRLVEGDTRLWYHYIAIHCSRESVLLAYNLGDDAMAKLTGPLRMRRIERSWLPRMKGTTL